MDAAMFNELRQNGVENLYFAPELYVTNNFEGLTMDEAVDSMTDTIIDRLQDAGFIQNQTVSGVMTRFG